MIRKFKPISISLSPNVQKDDVALALKLIFHPWKWKNPLADSTSSLQASSGQEEDAINEKELTK